MKIAVCIKSVIDVTFPFVVDAEKLNPLDEDIFYKVNPADKSAAELALTLKEAVGGEVVFVSYGPDHAEKALRDCLAMGGDQAIRVWEDRPASGSRSKAYMLAKAIEGLSADMVLCGARSLDEGTGETPAAMAEFLGVPQVIGITDLDLSKDQKSATVKRKLERGRREEIECPLPAVFAVEAEIRQPRYGALSNLLEAKRAEIPCLKGNDVEADASLLRELDSLLKIENRSLPRPRPKKTFNIDSGLTAEQRMELMMSGGLKQSSGDLLEGEPGELAGKIAGVLKEKIFKS